MRIALMPSAYAPSVGGVEVLTQRLAAHHQAAGHEVEVWTARSPRDALPPIETVDGITVRRITFPTPRAHLRSLVRWPPRAVASFVALRGAARQFQPDVVHVQCFSGNGLYAAALSRLSRTPLVVTLQGETVMDDADIYEHSMFMRMALRAGLRQATHVTGCSGFTLDDAIERFGLDPGKASVIFNGVDVDEVAPQPVELPFEKYVLGLGRFVEKKGFDLLVDAFAGVARQHPDVGLVLVGAGAAEQVVREQVERLNLGPRVHFAGSLRRGEVAYVMATADVFVMPSRVEPFGIVALEAWRGGTPVIVSSRGGAPEFVEHGETGFVVDPESCGDLAAQIETLLVSAEVRERFVRAGRDRLDRFAWHGIQKEYEQVYEAVLGRAVAKADHPRGDAHRHRVVG